MRVRRIEFTSPSGVCRAWHGVADTDVLAGPQGRPIVVMAHGVGWTVDSGLLPFAEPLCAIGCDVLAFDYYGFGASAGVGGQSVSMRRQVEDQTRRTVCTASGAARWAAYGRVTPRPCGLRTGRTGAPSFDGCNLNTDALHSRRLLVTALSHSAALGRHQVTSPDIVRPVGRLHHIR
jgi:pimeloyl-ACP methyl ester carboxylesterase